MDGSPWTRLWFAHLTFFHYLFTFLFIYLFENRMRGITVLLVTTLVGYAAAQVPGFGWCPDYSPMAEFDLNRYTGVWYEAERYFTVLEAGSRCVRSNYTRGVDGKFRVSNEITNRLTGIRRVLDGVVQNIGKGGEGKISVKYNTLPVPVDTQYSVLDTDYDTYSVVWSCSSLGPINTQNAWVMTRERLAPGTVLQQAYGVLDKYKISRTFFVKTDQSDCMFTDPAAIPPEINQFKTEETPVQVQTVQTGQSGQTIQTVQNSQIAPESPVKTESVIVREPVKVVSEQGKPVFVETFTAAAPQVQQQPQVVQHFQHIQPVQPIQQVQQVQQKQQIQNVQPVHQVVQHVENAPKHEPMKSEPVKEVPIQKVQVTETVKQAVQAQVN